MTSRHTPLRIRPQLGSTLLSALAVLMVLAVGCDIGTDEATLPETPSDSSLTVADTSVELPVVTQTPDEIRTEMSDYEPFTPGFEDARIKLLVRYEEIRKREGVEGFQESIAPQSSSPSAFADPATGRVAWRALCCFGPDCVGKGKGGGPPLFVQTFSHINVGPDGKLIVSQPNASELRSPPCPKCGKLGFIRAYDPPESELRRRKLVEELRQANAAYAAAAQNGRSMPSNLRPPNDIMLELTQLPKLFLVPEQ